jgi:putative DNA primase/helicase
MTVPNDTTAPRANRGSLGRSAAEFLLEADLDVATEERSDLGNAERLARLKGERLRFDHRRARWLVWGDHRWLPDSDGAAMRMAIAVARQQHLKSATIEDLNDQRAAVKWTLNSQSRKSLEAAMALAKNLDPIRDSGDQWDADPWLLGCPNGVLHLDTGEFRHGRPEDRITLQTGIDYNPDAECPRWLQFLDEVFGDDESLIDFVQMAVGYTLTGDTREEVLFLLHGQGSNGKTKFLGALEHVLGDYAATTPFTTLERHRDGARSTTNDLAALDGKRLVIASETGEGSRFDEQRIKALTGGDKIAARFLFKEFVEFRPAAKFWISVNHRPTVADDSYGFWRRVHLIPFNQTFEGDRRDLDLEAKLRAEAEGILAWAIRGQLAWKLAAHLTPPTIVTTATTEYRSESDLLGDFLSTRCVTGEGLQTASRDLWNAYLSWANDEGLSDRERMTRTKFGRRIGDRFPRPAHHGAGRSYSGIGLANAPEQEAVSW